MAEANRRTGYRIFVTLPAQRGVTFAYQLNMEGQMIKLLSDWVSDCYKRYIDVSIDQRYDSMKAFVEAINTLVAE